MTDTVTWQSMLNQVREERDALAAELAELKKHVPLKGGVPLKQFVQAERIRALEAALREIAVGLTADDAVAGFSQRYQLCAGRLCKIARDALTAPETPGVET